MYGAGGRRVALGDDEDSGYGAWAHQVNEGLPPMSDDCLEGLAQVVGELITAELQEQR